MASPQPFWFHFNLTLCSVLHVLRFSLHPFLFSPSSGVQPTTKGAFDGAFEGMLVDGALDGATVPIPFIEQRGPEEPLVEAGTQQKT